MDPGIDVPEVDLEDFLGLKAFHIVSAIGDPSLRERIMTAIQSCAGALSVLDDLDLSPHELADLETPNVAAWNGLAPEVRNVLVSVRATCDLLVSLFPAIQTSADIKAEDIENAFDSMTLPPSETGDGHRGRLIDGIVQGSTPSGAQGLGENVTTLVDVLKKDIVAFGNKLRNPQIVGERWFLLGEVHQFTGQCAQCLEALVATMLTAVSSEELSEMLPRYLDATMREIMLRGAATDLLFDVNQFNDAIARAPADELPILVGGLVERLNKLSMAAAYKLLKPQDKRAIIMIRIFLNAWETKPDAAATVRNEVEGFAKFLSLMRDLNWRESLMDHDKRTLLRLQRMLAAGVSTEEMFPQMKQLYGSFDLIDDRVRAMRYGIKIRPDEMRRVIFEAQSRFFGR
jgi:hypothetical protein